MCPVLWGVPYIHFLLTQAKAYDTRSGALPGRLMNLSVPRCSLQRGFSTAEGCVGICALYW